MNPFVHGSACDAYADAAQQQQLMSVQEAYKLMTDSGVTMEQYQVYCHLMRDGYIVRRHPVRWGLDTDETAHTVWGCSTPATEAASTRDPIDDITVSSSAQAFPKPTPVSRSSVKSGEEVGVSTTEAALPAATARIGIKRPREASASSTGSRLWWPALGPSHPWLGCIDQQYIDSLPKAQVTESALTSLACRFPALGQLPDIGCQIKGVNCAVGNSGGGGNGVHLPLTNPKLQRPMFDVYQPNSKFIRNKPDPIALRVVVCTPEESPSLQDLHALDACCPDTLVSVALVDTGNVTFHGFTKTQLPVIV